MELDATETERRQLAYATQFFDFTPDAYVDSITAPSKDSVNEHLDAAKERCATEFTGKVKEKDLEEAFVLIKDAYASNAAEVLEKFGRYLKKNIFHIPSDVVLPEDRPHLSSEGKSYNGQKLEQDLQSLDEMRQEVANVKYRRVVLKDKLANLEMVAERKRKLLAQVEQFNAEKVEIETMVDDQMNKLQTKVSGLKSVLEQIENNFPAKCHQDNNNPLKRKVGIREAILAKKMCSEKEN